MNAGTGSARICQIPWKERDHALFVAFAPVGSPRYVCATVVEHGGASGGGGSAVAAPICRDILLEVQRRDPRGVFPQIRWPSPPAAEPWRSLFRLHPAPGHVCREARRHLLGAGVADLRNRGLWVRRAVLRRRRQYATLGCNPDEPFCRRADPDDGGGAARHAVLVPRSILGLWGRVGADRSG